MFEIDQRRDDAKSFARGNRGTHFRPRPQGGPTRNPCTIYYPGDSRSYYVRPARREGAEGAPRGRRGGGGRQQERAGRARPSLARDRKWARRLALAAAGLRRECACEWPGKPAAAPLPPLPPARASFCISHSFLMMLARARVRDRVSPTFAFPPNLTEAPRGRRATSCCASWPCIRQAQAASLVPARRAATCYSSDYSLHPFPSDLHSGPLFLRPARCSPSCRSRRGRRWWMRCSCTFSSPAR